MRRLSDNGRYVLGELLGSGGQGRVCEGRQLDLDRRVAIKQLHDGGQIRHEARLLAALRHPNILAVHELIEVDGKPALVLEHIEGTDLSGLLADVELDVDTAEALWFAMVDAVAHAHRQGVVHGDLSPSNVMIEISDGTARPKICDFGVGRSAANPLGASGSTEGFVAPERRDGGQPTMASDVYSLAALGRFLLPGEYSPRVEEALALALAPEPASRPGDAAELAARLGMDGHTSTLSPPVRIAAPKPRRQWWGLAAVALASVGLFGAFSWKNAELPSTVDPILSLAAMERWTTQPAEAAALWHAAGTTAPPEARALGADSRVLAMDAVVTQVAASGHHLLTADENGRVQVWDPQSGEVLHTLETGVVHPQALAASETHFTLIAHPVLGKNPSHCAAWALATGECRVRTAAPPYNVLLGANGDIVWYALKTGETAAVSLDSGQHLWTAESPSVVRGALHAELPDQLAELADGRLEAVDLRTGERRLIAADLPEHRSHSFSWSTEGFRWADRDSVTTISEDGAIAVSASHGHLVKDTTLGLTHSGGRSRIGTLHTPSGSRPLRHVGWHAPLPWGGPSLLATSPENGAVHLVDVRDGHVQRELHGHALSLLDMAVVEEWLVTTSLDRTVRIWRPHDLDTGWLERQLTGLKPKQLAVGEGVALLGLTDADQLAVWTSAHGILEMGRGDASHLDPHARGAAVVDSAGRVTVANLADGTTRTLDSGFSGSRCIQLSPGADRLLLSNVEAYRLLRLSDGEVLETGSLGEQPAGCAKLDGDGTVWLHAGSPGKVWSNSGEVLELPFVDGLHGLKFTAQGPVVVGKQGQVAMRQGTELKVVVPGGLYVLGIGAKRLAWADGSGTIHVDGEPWSDGHNSRIYALAWAPNDALLFAGRANGQIDAWTRSGRKVASIQAHDSRLSSLSIDPKSGNLVSVDLDGIVQWWDPSRLTSEREPLVTNMRPCRDAAALVAVAPFPDPESRWAPPELCP